MYKIYKHTLIFDCDHKGWSYIGLTKENNPNRRWRNGWAYYKCWHFWNALQCYGGLEAWDINWTHEIIEDNIETLAEANSRESYWIAYYHTWVADPQCKGYNLDSGGGTHECSDETRKKFSLIFTGRHPSEETRAKLSKANKGRAVSQVTREKISIAKKGKPSHNKGKPRSKEAIEKAKQTRLANGGYTHSIETKKKISNTLKQKGILPTVFRTRTVYCYELDREFESCVNAEQALNLPNGSIYQSILWRSRGRDTSDGGYHFVYANDKDNWTSLLKYTNNKPSKKTEVKIQCVETGEEFNSINEVLKVSNFSRGALWKHLTGKQKTCGGYHWKKIK